MSLDLDDFSQFEHHGWQRVASKYQDAWGGLTRLFIPHLLEAVGVRPGTKLLDVACGPGYAAEAAWSLGAEPIGVDFCVEMIRLARERNRQIEFRQGNAETLGFNDNSFDAVVMNFGVLHLSDPETAFAEAARVLRPGGRYGFTVWAGPQESAGARVVEEAIRTHADMNVALPKGPDYFGYGDPDECRHVLNGLGFDLASFICRSVTAEWSVPTASFLFESERDAGVRTAALLAAQTPERLSATKAQIEESVRAYAKGDGFAIPYTAKVIAVTAI